MDHLLSFINKIPKGGYFPNSEMVKNALIYIHSNPNRHTYFSDLVQRDIGEPFKNIKVVRLYYEYNQDEKYVITPKILYTKNPGQLQKTAFYYNNDFYKNNFGIFINAFTSNDIVLFEISNQLQTEVHSNLVLFIKKKDRWHWFYYEPHGYNTALVRGIVKLVYNITANINKIDKRIKFNNPMKDMVNYQNEPFYKTGLQKLFFEYDIGYCVYFCLFWYYLCMHMNNKDPNFNLNLVEAMLYEYYKDRKNELLNIIIDFSVYVSNYLVTEAKVVDLFAKPDESLQRILDSNRTKKALYNLDIYLDEVQNSIIYKRLPSRQSLRYIPYKRTGIESLD
jgi:hypothetical protein